MTSYSENEFRKRFLQNSLRGNRMFDLKGLVVGDGECTFAAIVGVICQSTSAGALFTKLMDVARSLGIPYDNILSMRNGLASGKISYLHALVQILMLWRAMRFSDATLSKLISTLEENHLNDIANSLAVAFNKHKDSFSVPIFWKEASSELQDEEGPAIPNSKPHDCKDTYITFQDAFQYEDIEPQMQKVDETQRPISLEGTQAQYDPTIKLGNGATSNVYEGCYGDISAAVKIVESGHFEYYKNEINVWQQMKQTIEENNLNIITLLCWKELATSKYLIVMERAICDLDARVKDLQPLAQSSYSEQEQLKSERRKIVGFINDAAKGLKWMHECENPIIHRDIKPENILICKTSTGEIAKLGDFGLSRKLCNSPVGTITGGKGTLRWMAPEAIKAFQFEEKYQTTKDVDIFSLGMTAHFAMSLGTHPFQRSEAYGIIEHLNISDTNIQPTVLGNQNFAADHILQWMMVKSIDGRPTIQQVVQHPCFWDWRKGKEFILAVAQYFDGTHGESIKKEIDEQYKLRIGIPVNWVDKLDKDVKTTLFDYYKKKNYCKNSDSIMKLVELMRDKNMHYRDMIKHAKTDEFKSQDSFDEGKYWNYFLTCYPELVIHLFCHLANRPSPESSLEELKKLYFVDFKCVPDWKYKLN